jgi:hypothetical protein
MALAEIQAAFEALAAQPTLLDEANFATRAEALDELEVHVLDRLDGLPTVGESAELSFLRKQASALKAQLQAADERLFGRLREGIRKGRYTPESLRAQLVAYIGPAAASWPNAATSYDSLDVLTNGLFPEPPELVESVAHEPEMVYYQKTPARVILELAAKITPQDVFYDLGSGLGQVPLLVHLLSGATTTGVEIEPGYCQHAQVCADSLGLTRVHFLCADARTVGYAVGTVFYLFTPFTGSILQQVLEQLRQLAQQKPLRIFSYGPSTEALVQQQWLQRLDAGERHLYQLVEFRSTP